MKRNGRVDANQGEIVRALRKAGCSVQSLAGVGDGVPDLLVARAGKLFLLEVKMAGKGLTKDQEEWVAGWWSAVHIVRTPEEALRAVGAIK